MVLDIEHVCFTPLVFNAMVGMARECTVFFRWLSSLLVDKREEDYSVMATWGRLNKIPVIRSHFVIFICATNCFNKMWYLIQWKVGFYSHESGILLRQIWKWNCGVLFSIWFTFHICLFIHVIQLSFEISFSGNNGIKTRILFSGIDKKRDLINLFWDPIQWISCLKQ